MDTKHVSIQYGAVYGLPENTTAAWGARMIVKQSGMVDVVPDRTDIDGATDEARRALRDALNGGILRDFVEDVSALLKRYTMRTDRGEPFVWQHGDVTLYADTNGSYGYLYVAAFTTAG